jgi:protein XagA
MRFKQITVLVLTMVLSLIFSPDNGLAGAWTFDKGKSYHRCELNVYDADENYATDGDTADMAGNGNFRDINLKYYLEYGITGHTTLITSLYYKYLVKEDDFHKDQTWGIGDIEWGLKHSLWQGYGGVLSTQGLVKIPAAYDDDDNVPLGDGRYDGEIRLLYGQSLWKLFPGYGNVEVAYRFREGDARDQIRYVIELGSDFGERWYGRVKLDGTAGLYNDEDILDDQGNPTATENYDLGKLDMAIGFKINARWGLEAGYTPTLYGENTAAGATWTIAVIFQP